MVKKIALLLALLSISVFHGCAPQIDPSLLDAISAQEGDISAQVAPNDLLEYSNQKRLEWFYQTRSGNIARLTARLKPFSKAAGSFADTKQSARLIPNFLQQNPSIKAMADHFDNPPSGLEGYDTFNSFFTRKLSEKGKEARPFNLSKESVSSPADSSLFVIPKLREDSDIFVKGSRFNLAEFLQDKELAKKYIGGTLLLFYLAPEDYHRFHFPFDAYITDFPKRISGYLDSVDPIAYTPNVEDDAYTSSSLTAFSKKPFTTKVQPLLSNERQLLTLHSEEFGNVLFIAIGAMMVGKIVFTYDKSILEHKKGDEMGYFAFGGSTLVLIFPPNAVKPLSKFVKQVPPYAKVYKMFTEGNPQVDRKTKVRLGEDVGLKSK